MKSYDMQWHAKLCNTITLDNFDFPVGSRSVAERAAFSNYYRGSKVQGDVAKYVCSYVADSIGSIHISHVFTTGGRAGDYASQGNQDTNLHINKANIHMEDSTGILTWISG